MRASEALILGSTMLKPKQRKYDDGNGNGCAWGMVNRAVGGNASNFLYRSEFPWIMQIRQFEWPVSLLPNVRSIAKATVETAVINLFDCHGWSATQIAEWLETVDPTPREVAPVEVEAPEEELVHA